MADKDTDLAIIKIDKDLPALSLARLDGMNPAEEVFSIGYPLGGSLPGEVSVIRGSFSRLIRDKKNGIQYLSTDITSVSGISGGPMVNIYEEVVAEDAQQANNAPECLPNLFGEACMASKSKSIATVYNKGKHFQISSLKALI